MTDRDQLDSPACKTDAQIAREMGISRTRVMQLRKRALAKIRQAVLHDPKLRRFIEDEFEIRVS